MLALLSVRQVPNKWPKAAPAQGFSAVLGRLSRLSKTGSRALGQGQKGVERAVKLSGELSGAGLVAPEVWVEMGSTESMACLSSTAAPWNSLAAAATSIAFQGPGQEQNKQ